MFHSQARQAVYNWRRAFFNRAKSVIYKAQEERFPVPKKGVRNDNTAAIAAWAKLANSYGGEAFWEYPDPTTVSLLYLSCTA